jgi:hypothetical protein
MGQMIMCTSCMSRELLIFKIIIIYIFCIEFINKNRGKWWDDVYIMNVKRYAIRTYSWLGMWYDIWYCVYITCHENYV